MHSRTRPGIGLTALAYIAFISLGLPDGLLGVAWPSLSRSFDLPLDALGSLLVASTAGYLLSSFSSGRLLARMNVGHLLSLSCLATAIGLIGYALAPAWWIVVALGVLMGLGAGAIDAGLNTYAATHFTARSVNWLHGCYGIGATAGPLIVTAVLTVGRSWRMGYHIVGVWQVLLAFCFGLTLKWWVNGEPRSHSDHVASRPVAGPGTLRLPVAWLSLAVFFVYTGIEASVGAWSYSLLTLSRGVEPATAGAWVSFYWGSFTIGRFASGALVGRTSIDRLLAGSMIGSAAGATLIWIGGGSSLSLVGLVLMGVTAAPIFPSLIATTPARLGRSHTANAIGFQIAAAVLGQSLLPATVGVLARRLGLEVIGPALLVSAFILLVLFQMLVVSAAKKSGEAAVVSGPV